MKPFSIRFLLLVTICQRISSTIGSPVDEVEDDDELIKELEQLLKGTPNSQSNNNSNELNPTVPDPTNGAEVPSFIGEQDKAVGPVAVPSNGNGKLPAEEVDCQCMKYFECNVNPGGNGKGPLPVNIDNANNNGGGGNGNGINDFTEMELDIRLGGGTEGSQCAHYFDLCCNSIRNNVTSIRNPEYRHSSCGQRNLDGVGFRITGAVNQEAQFGEFPWMTAVVSPERQENGKKALNVFLCGGSLIHPKVVLTAAHCVAKKRAPELTVRLGEWDTQTADEVYKHRDHTVERIILHEDFYAGALYNDIALLILTEETKLAPHIDTICLPPSNVNFDGQRCFASGWGRDSYGKEGNYQVILKKLELPVVPRANCEYSLKKTRLGRYFRLHDSFVCAGGERGKDTCRGDGGSPLVCKVPGTESYIQYGIVAWGIGCGEEGVPGVYVNVPKFLPWISKKMSELRLDTRYFKLTRTGRVDARLNF